MIGGDVAIDAELPVQRSDAISSGVAPDIAAHSRGGTSGIRCDVGAAQRSSDDGSVQVEAVDARGSDVDATSDLSRVLEEKRVNRPGFPSELST